MSEEADRAYPIRITEPAANDIRAAYTYLRELTGDTFADSWEEGFYEAIRTLSRMPRKHPVAELETRRFGLEVRQMTYGRRGGAVYRVLFQIIGESDDAPFVRLLHVRHAARRPMTKKEAAEILRSGD